MPILPQPVFQPTPAPLPVRPVEDFHEPAPPPVPEADPAEEMDDNGVPVHKYLWAGVDSTKTSNGKKQTIRAYWCLFENGKPLWDKKLRINIETVDRDAYMDSRSITENKYHVENSHRDKVLERIKLFYGGTTYAEARQMGKPL